MHVLHDLVTLNEHYSIRVPGWLLKWLNLITALGSVSNQPGSVTWLATKYFKNPCCQLDKSHWQINYIGSTECEQHPWNQSRFCAEIQKNNSQVCKNLSIHLALVLKTSHWYRFHPFYLSFWPVLWHKCQRVFLGQLHISKACWELWLSDGQPHSDYNGQWQRALCILAVLQSSQPNSQRNKRNGKCML